MFLNYLALVVLIMGVTMAIYAFFTIHDIPHRIAKKRNHPHEDAIGAACWLSLFTLHAIWPIVFIWSMMHKPSLDIEVTETQGADGKQGHVKRVKTTVNVDPSMNLADMRQLVQTISQRIEVLEREQSSGKRTSEESEAKNG